MFLCYCCATLLCTEESAKDMLEVAIDELNLCGYDVEEVYDIEGLKRFAFDCDSMFEIIEI